jgi:hypothetical protein
MNGLVQSHAEKGLTRALPQKSKPAHPVAAKTRKKIKNSASPCELDGSPEKSVLLFTQVPGETFIS